MGMVSRVKRYIANEKVCEPYLGPFGEVQKRKPEQRLPILGQLDTGNLSLLQNDLYISPVFYSTADDY